MTLQTQQKDSMPLATFTITGDFITQAARDLMLSDEPGRAWRLLADCLIGEGSEAVARRVLAGEANLTGDSVSGVSVADADPEDVREYVDHLRYIYAGRVRLNGQWYRPRGVVESYGPTDARAAGPVPTKLGPLPALAAWIRRRAEFYAFPGERVARVEGVDGMLGGRYVVFAPCGEPPQWMRPVTDASAAVTDSLAAGRSLETLGYAATARRPSDEAATAIREGFVDKHDAAELRDLADAAENELREAELARIADAVREQAGDDVFDLTLKDGRIVQVPRAPFVHWALSRLPDLRPDALPPWRHVSPSGIKMVNDDPYHTDWVLGAGLTIGEGYDENVTEPAWDKATDIQIAEVDRA